MKKYLLLVISLVMLSVNASAQSGSYGISLGYGEADPDIEIYRAGIKKDFSGKWFESRIGYLSGYFELSYNRWEGGGQEINGVAFSPVFAYYFGSQDSKILPYIEGGIGGAYIDEYHIAGRNLATNLQFEDRVGIGARFGSFDLNLRYMHYSNASLKSPNTGIDIWIVTTGIRF